MLSAVLPDGDLETVNVGCHASTRAIAVNLELSIDDVCPAKGHCAKCLSADVGLGTIEPYVMVGDIPRAISRHAGLNVVPLADGPTTWIASRTALAYPVRPGAACTACIDCVSPFPGPAIALEASHDGLSVVHGLVYVELQIANLARRSEIHPSVVKDVLCARIVRERHAVTFRAIVRERGVELPRAAIFGWRRDDAHAAT